MFLLFPKYKNLDADQSRSSPMKSPAVALSAFIRSDPRRIFLLSPECKSLDTDQSRSRQIKELPFLLYRLLSDLIRVEMFLLFPK
jgi:hypothetical protein